MDDGSVLLVGIRRFIGFTLNAYYVVVACTYMYVAPIMRSQKLELQE